MEREKSSFYKFSNIRRISGENDLHRDNDAYMTNLVRFKAVASILKVISVQLRMD